MNFFRFKAAKGRRIHSKSAKTGIWNELFHFTPAKSPKNSFQISKTRILE